MTLRTVTYDESKFKIVPIEADEIQIQQGCLSQTIGNFANYEEWWDSYSSGVSERIRYLIAKDYRAMIAAAQEYQEPENPLDMPLPCDIRIGAGTIQKGCRLRVLVHRMNVLYQLAMKAQLGIGVTPDRGKMVLSQAQNRVPLFAEVVKILRGIDSDNTLDGGWWETSTGMEFGASKLKELELLFNNGGITHDHIGDDSEMVKGDES